MYFVIGIGGTVADWTVYFVLIYAGIFFMLSVAISYFVGMVINFYLNRRFTFKNTYQKVHFQFMSFGVIALIGFLLNEALIFAMVGIIFNNTGPAFLMLARIIATFIVFVWNYIANKRITFRLFK